MMLGQNAGPRYSLTRMIIGERRRVRGKGKSVLIIQRRRSVVRKRVWRMERTAAVAAVAAVAAAAFPRLQQSRLGKRLVQRLTLDS